jgi:hypothetical protein
VLRCSNQVPGVVQTIKADHTCQVGSRKVRRNGTGAGGDEQPIVGESQAAAEHDLVLDRPEFLRAAREPKQRKAPTVGVNPIGGNL